MKKSLIVILVIALVIGVELFLRQSDKGDEPPQPPPDAQRFVPEPPEADPQPQAPVAPPAADTAPAKAIPETPVDEQQPDAGKSENYAKACRTFLQTVIDKGGDGLGKADLVFASNQANAQEKLQFTSLLTEYVSCKAIEKQDFTRCVQLKKLVAPGNAVPCDLAFQLFIPLRAHFLARMTPEQFADLYEDLPKNVLDWMVAFMTIIHDQKPGDCERLSVDPLIGGVCTIAAGGMKDEPQDGDLRDAWYVIQALRTGQHSYLSQAQPGFPVDIVHVLLEQPGICEQAWTRELTSICDSVNPTDSAAQAKPQSGAKPIAPAAGP